MTKRVTKNYPLEFKQSSAKLAVDSECSISQTARELGINATTLYGWVKRFYPEQALKANKEDELNEEVKRLRREIVRLKQERDILKKAAVYFASEIS